VSRTVSGLFELLTEHGVSEKGARLYLAACRGGPATASELARLAAVHRVEAYRVLKALTADGLLTMSGTSPQRYVATPAGELVDRWIHHANERVRSLESNRARILSDWEEARTEVDGHDPRKFTVIDGRASIRRFLARRCGAAEREIELTGAGSWLAGLTDAGVDRIVREAAKRGVKVRVVTEVAPPDLPVAKHFAGFAELRHATTPISSRAAIIDRMGVLLYVSGEDGLGRSVEAQVALWSTDPAFVQLAREYHRRLWGPATRSEERFVELEHPPAALLPVVAGRESVPFQRLKEVTKLGMRASGVRELHLRLPELIETIARQLGREVADGVEGRTPEEVSRSLARYYATHTMGRLEVVRDRPLTLRVTGCFACTEDSPEIGRVLCPELLRSVLETRLGRHWEVSKPDPTKHAARGCVFVATAA
jgi:HTH-type transcriptional regulator, sugar sensing transcriptional regulator